MLKSMKMAEKDTDLPSGTIPSEQTPNPADPPCTLSCARPGSAQPSSELSWARHSADER